MPDALGTRATAVREAIADLCEHPPGPDELVREVAERLRRVVPYDIGAWMTTDPETLVPTAMFGIKTTLEMAMAMTDAEMRRGDVNSFGEMQLAGRTTASLSGDTGGELERSARYRLVHLPNNLGDELRIMARTGHETWAIACLTRGADVQNFSPDEVRYTGQIADLLGQGVRASLASTQPDAEPIDALGMLVLRADDTIEASTGQAMRWLGRLPMDNRRLPTAISMVSLMARANAAGQPGAQPARLRLRLSTGGWLLIHADVLDGGEAGRTAVVLEPADRAQLLPLLFALHGLTGRERQIAELLIAGSSTDEIAAQLHISRHTLRDHVKAIFAKVGVSSRPELTAALAA